MWAALIHLLIYLTVTELPATYWALLWAEHDLHMVPCRTGRTVRQSIRASCASAPLGDGSDSQLLSQSRLSLYQKPERGRWDEAGQGAAVGRSRGLFVSWYVCAGEGGESTTSVFHTGFSKHLFLEPAK